MTELMIDVQSIPAETRQTTIFKSFDALADGESLVIINNHDPRPLLKKFDSERPNQFTEDYLVSGPTEWKVKLTKGKKEGCCGCCGL